MNTRLGERIKELRWGKGWSQEMLSEQVTLSRASIANIEAGRQAASLDAVVEFSEAFGIKPQKFMKGVWYEGNT